MTFHQEDGEEVPEFLSLEMRRQRLGSSRFWGEKEVVGEELEREIPFSCR